MRVLMFFQKSEHSGQHDSEVGKVCQQLGGNCSTEDGRTGGGEAKDG